MHGSKGFSLIELLIVLVIIAVATVAIMPAYSSYQKQTHSTLVKAELLDLANRLEQGYSSVNGYSPVQNYGFPEDNPRYNISIQLTNNHEYLLRATPLAKQANEGLIELYSTGEKHHYDSDSGSGSYKAW